MSSGPASVGENVLPQAPSIQGLRFRHFRGDSDFADMIAIMEGIKEVDHIDFTESPEDLARKYRNLTSVDLHRDVLFAEVDGNLVGFTNLYWDRDPNGVLLYHHSVSVLPRWRRKGLCNVMLRYNEQRLREIAKQHPANGPRFFQAMTEEGERHWAGTLISEGYRIFRFGLRMARPNLDDIPGFPLPEGVEVRPVKPEHYKVVIDAWNEACKDMRGQVPISDEILKEFQQSPVFQPSLWQIAWHGDQVIGTVLNWVDERENAEHHRKRGHCELISVRPPWRGKGIAKALIARSFTVLKERGMTEAALGVDSENPSGARQLYEKMGFKVEKRVTFFRKPL